MYLSLMTRCKLQIMARIMALAIMLVGLSVGAQASSYTETQLIQRAEQAISKISTLQAKFLQVSSMAVWVKECCIFAANTIASGISKSEYPDPYHQPGLAIC